MSTRWFARASSSGADGAWRVDGACTVEEFNRRFGPLLPEGEYETVAGLVLDRLGEIPEVGVEILLPGAAARGRAAQRAAGPLAARGDRSTGGAPGARLR